MDDLLTFSWLQKDSEIEAGQEAQEPSENAKEERTFASLIISGTISNIDLSANWSFDRINKVALAILRTSAYEILYQKDVSPKIIIDEAVNIAKNYGTDDSYKFINAILDKIGKNE